jgi:hypothetical protein
MTDLLQKRLAIAQDRYGFKTMSYLSAGAADLPYEISERLRAARAQAVSKRKIVKMEPAGGVVNAGGSAALSWGSDDGLSWWARIGSVVPLIALVVGLLTINSIQSDNRDQEVAEVDAALLTDELPPAAFADPGFIQFLKATR